MYNLNIERAVIATILYSPEKVEDILDSLKWDDFYHPAHKSIYDTIVSLNAKNLPIDEDFIQKHYSGGEWDSDTMFEILGTTPLPNVRVYIDELKSLSKTRKTALLFREGLSKLDNGEDTDAVLAELESASTKILDEDIKNIYVSRIRNPRGGSGVFYKRLAPDTKKDSYGARRFRRYW